MGAGGVGGGRFAVALPGCTALDAVVQRADAAPYRGEGPGTAV
ncbi:hypothetical protein [Kineococcus sp. SYSU DK004]